MSLKSSDVHGRLKSLDLKSHHSFATQIDLDCVAQIMHQHRTNYSHLQYSPYSFMLWCNRSSGVASPADQICQNTSPFPHLPDFLCESCSIDTSELSTLASIRFTTTVVGLVGQIVRKSSCCISRIVTNMCPDKRDCAIELLQI